MMFVLQLFRPMKVRESVIRSRNDGTIVISLLRSQSCKESQNGHVEVYVCSLFLLVVCPESQARRMVVALPEIRLLTTVRVAE
jgi:hypothetical protein